MITHACVTKANGNPNGQQNPSNFQPYIDDWGNAIDFQQRAAATFANAKNACESRGGRLPLATELYRLRYNQGVVPNELGQSGTATQDYLWTMNPSYRDNYHIQLRLSDGSATDVASNGAATAPYRCIWPASRPSAFSGHACYGAPGAPCFEAGRLRTDRFMRARIPQASAQWECRYLGGRLAKVGEVAELRQAGMPNTVSGQWEWTSEWSYHSNGNTYIYMTSRGNKAAVADWQNNQGIAEAGWDTYGNYYGFRCLFTDIME